MLLNPIFFIAEFIQQDIKETELGLPHRCPTTREPVAVAKSQAGFIRFLVMPTWTRLCVYVGGKYGSFWKNRLKAQISYWNESRRLAEFKRGGRTVMALTRLSRMSSQRSIDLDDVEKVQKEVDAEEQAAAATTSENDITVQLTSSSPNNIDDRKMIDKTQTRSVPEIVGTDNKR